VQPEEREYVVGPAGFKRRKDRVIIRYEPGARVWLRAVPPGADLSPTGAVRRYETKGVPRVKVPRPR
jgi:hypothetical protein